MGCNGSKIDAQEAVSLCRTRADLLSAAVRHRYSLAESHAALATSLLSISDALHLLLSAKPLLSLPPNPKSSSPPPGGSHLALSSSSSSSADDDASSVEGTCHECQHHQQRQQHIHIHYARSRPPPPSVTVTRTLDPTANVYYSYPYSYEEEFAAPPPRPPPSPPRTDAWDFFNPFDAFSQYESYYNPIGYGAYTPSRSSREVREEEGIPDLEEDEIEVLKSAHSSRRSSSLGNADNAGRARNTDAESRALELEGDEAEAGFIDKEVVVGGDGDMGRRRKKQASSSIAVPKFKRVGDVPGEIRLQFVKASDAVQELSSLLEVGQTLYHPKSTIYNVSSRMVSAMVQPERSMSGAFLDASVGSKSLSSTLQKLYIWEKKLYDEVRAEEKMRLLLAKSSKRLKMLDQKGAESHKIDATRILIRKLSTRIRIAIKVVEKISRKIGKLRDEDLWPQINILIQGFIRMWHEKLVCHQIQCKVILETKNWESDLHAGNVGDAAMQLEVELMKWIANFSSWVSAQRNFVKSLNGWLVLCLNHEPADGCPPSPRRIGAPPIFVICNKWSHAMDSVSESEVVDAMKALACNVRQLWEQQSREQYEQSLAIRERERWARIVEKKTQEMNKEVDSLNRKLSLVPGQRSSLPYSVPVYEIHTSEVSNLRINLRYVLEALEAFASKSLRAFEEILQQTEEYRISVEHSGVS